MSDLNAVTKTIKDLNEDERPRERLKKNGSESLSDSELLAILIRNGTKGYSAIEIARDIIKEFSSLSKLHGADYSVFKKFKGLGDTKAITLAAAFELVRRVQSEPFINNNKIMQPQDVANYYIPRLKGLDSEIFRVLLLSSSNRIFRDVVISHGTLNASLAHPREVFKLAITESAASIILLHNHPSGNPDPSQNDISITRQLADSGEIIGIKVLDHIIIAGDRYTSLKQSGLM